MQTIETIDKYYTAIKKVFATFSQKSNLIFENYITNILIYKYKCNTNYLMIL